MCAMNLRDSSKYINSVSTIALSTHAKEIVHYCRHDFQSCLWNTIGNRGYYDKTKNYLSHFPPETQQRILLGTLASVYTDENAPSDIVAWLAADKDSQWFKNSSIARRTIKGLEQLNILNNSAPQ